MPEETFIVYIRKNSCVYTVQKAVQTSGPHLSNDVGADGVVCVIDGFENIKNIPFHASPSWKELHTTHTVPVFSDGLHESHRKTLETDDRSTVLYTMCQSSEKQTLTSEKIKKKSKKTQKPCFFDSPQATFDKHPTMECLFALKTVHIAFLFNSNAFFHLKNIKASLCPWMQHESCKNMIHKKRMNPKQTKLKLLVCWGMSERFTLKYKLKLQAQVCFKKQK